MKRLFLIVFTIFVANISYSQQKELDRLRSLVSRGKLEKAQTYCDKVTAGLSDKKSEIFNAIMARGYFSKKRYDEAADKVLKSNDKRLAKQIADKFKQSDELRAAELYVKAEKFDKASNLFFKNEKYEKSANYSDNPDKNKEYATILFNKGKIDESLFFYKKSKKKGEKFKNTKILDYLYDKKDYNTAYQIYNYNERGFSFDIQARVFNKMVEKAESTDFMKKFMQSVHIPKNKQHEVIVAAYASNRMFDKLESYCMKLNESEKKTTLSFIASNEQEKNPEISAWANHHLGHKLLCNDLLTKFLIEKAVSYNQKWDNESSISKKLVEEFIKSTRSHVQKCEKNYCETVKYAKNRSFNKGTELKQENPDLSAKNLNISNFLKAVESKCK